MGNRRLRDSLHSRSRSAGSAKMVQTLQNPYKNKILAGLADADRLLPGLAAVEFRQRQVIYASGSPFEYVYFLEDGVASVLTVMSDGGTVEVGMIGTEGLLGLPALLGGAVAVQHVVIQIPGNGFRISMAACKMALEGNAELRSLVLHYAEVFMNITAQTAACNRLHTIEQRCARWILMASDRSGSDAMPMTHEFLSSMLGARRVGVTQVAGHLRDAGIIRYERGRLTILDRHGLEALACECYLVDHRSV